jgi:glycosyltransferase involved in cell wall biosynthesis
MKVGMASAYFCLMRGGGEYYTLYLSRALARIGCDIHIICGRGILGRPSPLSEEFPLHLAAQLFALRDWAMRGGPISPILWRVHEYTYAASSRRKMTAGYDVIHAHDPGSQIAALGRGKNWPPVVATLHGPPSKRLARRLKRADAVLAVSKDVASKARGLGIECQVVEPGVDIEIFHPRERETCKRDTNLEGTVVLSVARLVPIKGLGSLIEAMIPVRKEVSDANLVLVGEGPSRQSLEALARSTGVTGMVRFEGNVPHERLPEYYSAASALVLPSFYESFPITTLEAMASGCPVIVTPSIRANMRMQDDSALVVEPGNPGALAEAILSLLKDEDKSGELSQRGVSFARGFDWNERATLVKAVYEGVAR